MPETSTTEGPTRRRSRAKGGPPRRNGPPPTAPHGTPARARKHYRDGEKPCAECLMASRWESNSRRGCGSPGGVNLIDTRERRNNLPEFVPYVYRGLGYDVFTGPEVADE